MQLFVVEVVLSSSPLKLFECLSLLTFQQLSIPAGLQRTCQSEMSNLKNSPLGTGVGDVNTTTKKSQQVLAYSVVRFLLKNVRSNCWGLHRFLVSQRNCIWHPSELSVIMSDGFPLVLSNASQFSYSQRRERGTWIDGKPCDDKAD